MRHRQNKGTDTVGCVATGLLARHCCNTLPHCMEAQLCQFIAWAQSSTSLQVKLQRMWRRLQQGCKAALAAGGQPMDAATEADCELWLFSHI